MDPETRGEILDQIKNLSRIMREKSKVMKSLNFTRKTQGDKYPIQQGYATAVRRPIRDLLKWMGKVEETISLIVDLLEEADQ